MGLTGYNSTCAVSEVFKGLLNGEEFYYYYDSENLCTVLKLADNSSWLEFSDLGGIGSIINISALRNKYNGGMCLGDFSYSDKCQITDNLKSISNFNVLSILSSLVSPFVDSSVYIVSGGLADALVCALPYALFALSVAQIYLILDPDSCVGVGEDEYWETQKQNNYTEYNSQINSSDGINRKYSINFQKIDINDFYRVQEENKEISKNGGGALDPRKDPEKMGVKLAVLIKTAEISFKNGNILDTIYYGALSSASIFTCAALTANSWGEEVISALRDYLLNLNNSTSKD